MKRIRNVTKAWLRLGELIAMNAQAVKHHRPRSDIQREMVKVRAEILDFENRKDKKLVARGMTPVGQLTARLSERWPAAHCDTLDHSRARPLA